MDQRKLKGEETKAKIIEAALMIISEEGTSGLSSKKIADLGGISKSNVFHHFSSVDDILHAVLEGVCSYSDEVIDVKSCIDVKDFLMQIGTQTFTLQGKDLAIYKVLFAYYEDVIFHKRFKHYLDRVKEKFMMYLMNSFEILGYDNTEVIAELITVDLDGLGLHYLVELDSKKYMALWQIKCEMYIEYFKRR